MRIKGNRATSRSPRTPLSRALDRSVSAYNRAVGTLETRVLISARRFRELGGGSKEAIPESSGIDQAPRKIQSEELAEAEPAQDLDD